MDSAGQQQPVSKPVVVTPDLTDHGERAIHYGDTTRAILLYRVLRAQRDDLQLALQRIHEESTPE